MNGNVCVYSFADASSLTKYVEDTGADYFFTTTDKPFEDLILHTLRAAEVVK